MSTKDSNTNTGEYRYFVHVIRLLAVITGIIGIGFTYFLSFPNQSVVEDLILLWASLVFTLISGGLLVLSSLYCKYVEDTNCRGLIVKIVLIAGSLNIFGWFLFCITM